MVCLNQRSFPTIQESVEVPGQGISPTGKEGLPRGSLPPEEKHGRGAGTVPVTASVPTRQLDPRPRTQTRPAELLIDSHPVIAAVNRAGEPTTATVATEPDSRDLGRRPPMGVMQTQTPTQPMRVQYDLVSGQSFLTPIRGEDARPVPHTDAVFQSQGHDTQEDGTQNQLHAANTGYARGGGILRLPPPSPGRPSGGGQINWGPTVFRTGFGRWGGQRQRASRGSAQSFGGSRQGPDAVDIRP